MRWDLSSKTDGVSKDMSWISALSQGRLLLHYPFNFARNNRTKLQQLCSFFEFKQLSSCNNELCSPVLAVQLMYTKAERIQFVCVQWGVYATRWCKHAFVCARLQKAN